MANNWMAWTGRRAPTGREVNPRPIMTKNKAAAEVRHKILRKIRVLEGKGWSMDFKWSELKTYIKGMAKRASSKKGGLGRR